jgi:hypothetical protein
MRQPQGTLVRGNGNGWNVIEVEKPNWNEKWYYVRWKSALYYSEPRFDKKKAISHMNDLQRRYSDASQIHR